MIRLEGPENLHNRLSLRLKLVAAQDSIENGAHGIKALLEHNLKLELEFFEKMEELQKKSYLMGEIRQYYEEIFSSNCPKYPRSN